MPLTLQRLATTDKRGTCLHGILYLLQNLVPGADTHQRSQLAIVGQRITYFHFFIDGFGFFYKFIHNRFQYNDAFGRGTYLSAVGEATHSHHLYDVVYIVLIQYQTRIASAQFQYGFSRVFSRL